MNSRKRKTTLVENEKATTSINVDNESAKKVCSKSNESAKIVKIGSRKSKLAVIQAECVIKLLDEEYNKKGLNYKFELSTISTKGDKILDVPLSNIGSKALFTKELEVALLDKQIDLIVHSCKDLPTKLPANLCISAILRREMADDVLVVKKGLEDKFKSVNDFLKNHHLIFKDKTIGTSSLRRIAQLKRINSKIKVADIRGNIDTRLNKLDAENSLYSALILAGAGLRRGGFSDRITASLDQNWWYAVGQGALAIECREGDEFIHNLLYPLIDHETTFQVLAERSFMQFLEGGCSIPLGVRCEFVLDNEPNDKKNKDQVIKNKQMKKEVDQEIKNNNGAIRDENQNNKKDEQKVKEYNEKIKNGKNQLDDVSNLKLSGVVISLDGQKCVQYEYKIKDIDLNLIENNKIDCTKIVLPTDKCLRMAIVKEQYYSCAKLGIYLAKKLQTLGAQAILDEINKIGNL